MTLSSSAFADDEMTAGSLFDRMSRDEFSGYIAGVVEGLAQARYEKDGNDKGMRCIYDWFYADGGAAPAAVIAAFDRYPDYGPGAVISGLLRKECPA